MYEDFLASFDLRREEPNTRGAIEFQIRDGVGVVAMSNEGSRNALTLSMWQQLEDVFHRLGQVQDLRVVVLRGAGTREFAAGADISEFPENRFDSAQAFRYNGQLSRTLRAVASIEIPTIAMIRGFAVGGGCELASACDLHIGADDAQMGIPIGRLGVTLGLTESKLLLRQVGVSGLKRILFTGELFDAVNSLRLGLLDEVIPAERLARRISAILTSIVGSSAITMSAAKVVTDLSSELKEDTADRVNQFLFDAYDGPDLREGVQAFLEKRPPTFPERG